jgi:hypothetical protein
MMDLKKVIDIFGKARELAKAVKVSDFTVNRWKQLGEIPDPYKGKVKTALKRRKKALDKAYNEVMK